MLIQLPSGSPDPAGSQNAEECNGFEAGLRRDLASAPIVSFDTMLGGYGKRLIDLTLAVVAAPLWLPLLALCAIYARLRFGAPAIRGETCIGYGGRPFKCLNLNLGAVEPPGDAPAPANDGRRRGLGSAFKRLPQLINVVAGDMALIGPSPLSREQLEPLKSARRYYLSARPGLTGLGLLAENGVETPGLYKTYAVSWSAVTDALILWDALRRRSAHGRVAAVKPDVVRAAGDM
ncbi:MAG: sugar transferase [Hyphomonadaceae bacterium]